MLYKFRIDEVSGTGASANWTLKGAETLVGETDDFLCKLSIAPMGHWVEVGLTSLVEGTHYRHP